MNIIASSNPESVHSKLLEIDKCEFASELCAVGTTFNISIDERTKPLIIRALAETVLENYELPLLNKTINTD